MNKPRQPSFQILRQMSTRKNMEFYHAFLDGKVGAETPLPAWILPKLVLDGRAHEIMNLRENMPGASAKKKGAAIEWALIFLEQKIKLNSSMEEKLLDKTLGCPDARIDAFFSALVSLEQRNSMLNEASDMLYKALARMEGKSGYKIESGWVLEKIRAPPPQFRH